MIKFNHTPDMTPGIAVVYTIFTDGVTISVPGYIPKEDSIIFNEDNIECGNGGHFSDIDRDGIFETKGAFGFAELSASDVL